MVWQLLEFIYNLFLTNNNLFYNLLSVLLPTMKKLFLKFFLLHCFLLLSGYTYLQAHVIQNEASHYLIKKSKNNQSDRLANIEKSHSNGTNFTAFEDDDDELKLRSTIDSDEEEKLISLKKYADVRNYFTTFFGNLCLKDSLQSTKKYFQDCKYSAYFTSQKWFIVFRVIRI